LGDGLFAGNTWDSPPLTMVTFGNKTPNSLFFATDPVAIDSVMHDFLAAEWTINSGANNYLRLANLPGLASLSTAIRGGVATRASTIAGCGKIGAVSAD